MLCTTHAPVSVEYINQLLFDDASIYSTAAKREPTVSTQSTMGKFRREGIQGGWYHSEKKQEQAKLMMTRKGQWM